MIVRVALDLAEQEDGRHRLLQAQLIERAHLEMRVGALDDFERPDLVGNLETLAKIGKG